MTLTCVTLAQPRASLVVAGVQTIITLPRPTAHRGHLGIHAGATLPLGCVDEDDDRRDSEAWRHWDDLDLMAMGAYKGPRSQPRESMWSHPTASPSMSDLPLGAIIGTADVVDCVPIRQRGEYLGLDTNAALVRFKNGVLVFMRRSERRPLWDACEATDQFPFADFTPGRWALILSDPQPATTRCPACWGTGTTGLLLALCGDAEDYDPDDCCVMAAGHSGPHYHESDVASGWPPAIEQLCPECLNWPSGTCPPILAKGRGGLWGWT